MHCAGVCGEGVCTVQVCGEGVCTVQVCVGRGVQAAGTAVENEFHLTTFPQLTSLPHPMSTAVTRLPPTLYQSPSLSFILSSVARLLHHASLVCLTSGPSVVTIEVQTT